MFLIFGGAYQGKLDYALERFGLNEDDVFRCVEENTAMPGGRKVVYEIDKWILALVRAGADVSAALQQFIQRSPDTVVICNDISCGVVPMGADMRQWREAAGRSMAELARASDEVFRLFCGIPTKIK